MIEGPDLRLLGKAGAGAWFVMMHVAVQDPAKPICFWMFASLESRYCSIKALQSV